MNAAGARRRAGPLLLAAVWLAAFAAGARPLDEVRQRGAIAMCANPDALPWASSNGAGAPGFQVEIARAVAARLGVRLEIDWIVPRRAARTLDCDLQLDVAALPEVEHPGLRLSVPYQTNGVVLAIAPGHAEIVTLADLHAGARVAVVTNSIASREVGTRGIDFEPFFTDDEVMRATAGGETVAGAVSAAALGYYNVTHPGQALRNVSIESLSAGLQWPVAIGMRRADAALETAVNEALRALLAAGTIESIYSRYGVAHRLPQPPVR